MILNSECSQPWLLTTTSGKSLAKVVRSNEWVSRDSVTSVIRTAARIVEIRKDRASAGLCAPFKLSLLGIVDVDELCPAKPRAHN